MITTTKASVTRRITTYCMRTSVMCCYFSLESNAAGQLILPVGGQVMEVPIEDGQWITQMNSHLQSHGNLSTFNGTQIKADNDCRPVSPRQAQVELVGLDDIGQLELDQRWVDYLNKYMATFSYLSCDYRAGNDSLYFCFQVTPYSLASKRGDELVFIPNMLTRGEGGSWLPLPNLHNKVEYRHTVFLLNKSEEAPIIPYVINKLGINGHLFINGTDSEMGPYLL